jgi:hypothetical protein
MKPLLFALVLTALSALTSQRLAPANECIQSPAANSPTVVPDAFKQIDFRNLSYPYKFSFGKRVEVALKGGEYEYDFKDEQGSFKLANVYFADLTGDSRPEAIVMLWHVSCGVSCDGGAAHFYVYSVSKHQLKSLWRYETGSLAYGCGLKSFAIDGTRITVELFGQCVNRKDVAPETRKFQAKDITRLTFESNANRIVARKRTLIPTPERSVLNYEPQISIRD